MNKQETKTDSNNVKTIATDKTYKVIITARFCHSKSKARGVLQDNMANSYNGDDFESGLLTLSKRCISN